MKYKYMAFLGIKINHEVGRLLSLIDVPGDKCDLSSFHITLLCFEDSMSINKIAKAMVTAFKITENEKPFTVKVDHLSSFPEGENGIPIILPVVSKELFEFREKLAKEFDKAKISYYKNFDFNPHITLSYSKEKPKKIKFDKLEFGVQEIVLWGGDNGDDKIFVTFPFNLTIKKSSLDGMILKFAANEYLHKNIK